MNKIKSLIIFLIIAVVGILIALSVLKLTSNTENTEYLDDYSSGVATINEFDALQNVQEASTFFTIENLVNYALSNSEIVYNNLLDSQYIKAEGITKNNFDSMLEKYELKNFNAKQIKQISDKNIYMYYAYGKISEEEMDQFLKGEDFFAVVKFDLEQFAYSIIIDEKINTLEELIKKYPIAENNSTLKLNDYNLIRFANVTTEQLVLLYFSDYKSKIESNIEEAYNMLDEEYKLKRFGSLNEFKNYVQENQGNINNAYINKYQKYEETDIIRYVCIDNNGNYYIFYETDPMQYTVILDTYTLDTPEFVQKYNSANEQGKVALNIQKIIQAINNKDYKYVYNCLSDGFKNNYFKTQERFEQYIENNFYNYNNIEYKIFEEQSGLYKYEIIIKDANNENKQFTKIFIVKLNEGTEFEFSLNI